MFDFYEALLDNKCRQAWTRIKNTDRWQAYTANDMFRCMWRTYERTLNTKADLERRKQWIMEMIVRNSHDSAYLAALESKVEKLFENQEPLFNNVKRAFYMIDLYPNNADRFPISYDEVVSASR